MLSRLTGLLGRKRDDDGIRATAQLRKILEAQVRAGVQARELPRSGTPVRLGRAPSNDLVIEDGSVSDQHAQIKWEKNRVWVRDLGSSSGTVINVKRIAAREWVPVGPTDKVFLGRQELTLDIVLEPLPQSQPQAPTYSAWEPVDEEEDDDAQPDAPSDSLPFNKRQLRTALALVAVVLFIFVLIGSGGGESPQSASTPSPAQEWSFRGRVQVPKGKLESSLTLRMPEAPFVLNRDFVPDESGFYDFDFPVRVINKKPARVVEVELRQKGKLIDSAKGLKLPPSGQQVMLPYLGPAKSSESKRGG